MQTQILAPSLYLKIQKEVNELAGSINELQDEIKSGLRIAVEMGSG